MRRLTFPVIAVLALVCASSGIWFGGLRNEIEIARRFERLPRLDGTPFFRCADSFYWVSYAREMLDTGNLRARFTRMDNAPYGRPNYGWASLNAWYLIALAKIWSIATGIPLRTALLPAAMWSGPILYSLALVVILAIGWLRQSFPSAAAAALVLGSSPRIYDDFAYAVPGHHGWMIWLVLPHSLFWREQSGKWIRRDGSRPLVLLERLQSGSAQPSRHLGWLPRVLALLRG